MCRLAIAFAALTHTHTQSMDVDEDSDHMSGGLNLAKKCLSNLFIDNIGSVWRKLFCYAFFFMIWLSL